jgi:hypothetical protein
MSIQLIQLRRGTTAEWADANPVLSVAEPGWDTELHILKIGNGVDTWTELPTYGDSESVVVDSTGFEYVQSIAMGTWTIVVPPEFGRRPSVEVYVAGERVIPDIVASTEAVIITFATPVTGTAVLT